MTAAQPAAPEIQVRGITKSFAGIEVLRGVDLDVAAGSVVALLGSHGAGKTTLVRVLATLLAPDSGSAQVGGHSIGETPQRVRESISLTGQFAAASILR